MNHRNEDIEVLISHPWLNDYVPLSAWLQHGPGARQRVHVVAARERGTHRTLPVSVVPLAYRNTRLARFLIRMGWLEAPFWASPRPAPGDIIQVAFPSPLVLLCVFRSRLIQGAEGCLVLSGGEAQQRSQWGDFLMLNLQAMRRSQWYILDRRDVTDLDVRRTTRMRGEAIYVLDDQVGTVVGKAPSELPRPERFMHPDELFVYAHGRQAQAGEW